MTLHHHHHHHHHHHPYTTVTITTIFTTTKNSQWRRFNLPIIACTMHMTCQDATTTPNDSGQSRTHAFDTCVSPGPGMAVHTLIPPHNEASQSIDVCSTLARSDGVRSPPVCSLNWVQTKTKPIETVLFSFSLISQYPGQNQMV